MLGAMRSSGHQHRCESFTLSHIKMNESKEKFGSSKISGYCDPPVSFLSFADQGSTPFFSIEEIEKHHLRSNLQNSLDPFHVWGNSETLKGSRARWTIPPVALPGPERLQGLLQHFPLFTFQKTQGGLL